MNRLYFGDNLQWLRERKSSPPPVSISFTSTRPLTPTPTTTSSSARRADAVSQAQFHAFTDTWSVWADAAETYHQFIDTCPNVAVTTMMEAFHSFLKNSPMMAYLAMMAPRLVELHRVLKSNRESVSAL